MKRITLKHLVNEIRLSEEEFASDRSTRLSKSINGKTVKNVLYNYPDGTMTITFTDGTAVSIVAQCEDSSADTWLTLS
jgi:hypothetical protein